MMADLTAAPLLVDAHVHIHATFDLYRFLDAAAANFRRAAAAMDLPGDTPGCLLLTETGPANVFADLRKVAGAGAALDNERDRPNANRWRFSLTAEPESVVAVCSGSPRILIVAGRQIVTTDGLEVLALLTTRRFEQPLDLHAAIAATQAAGGIPVLPWGFGKWTLRRRAIVASALRGAARPLFVGDNGGRPRALPMPRLLRQAMHAGVPVLPGSDPLPFPDQHTRAGGHGFVAHIDVAADTPARQLRDWLRALHRQPPVYGRGEGMIRFARNQLRMQIRKHVVRPTHS
jgi:hypothetical protein